jgi:hypothetical protein
MVTAVRASVCSVSRLYGGRILKMATAAPTETLAQLKHMMWQYPELHITIRGVVPTVTFQRGSWSVRHECVETQFAAFGFMVYVVRKSVTKTFQGN